MIYADHAASTALDPEALEAMLPWLREEYANPSQPYSFAKRSAEAVENARRTVADCVGADAEEIFFTSGGTESDNWAIKSAAYTGGRGEIVTSAFEHAAILRSCESAEKSGLAVTYLRPSADGYVTPGELENSITDRTALVSVMSVNNELGTIQPIRELCAAAHARGTLFHTDAVQAVGSIPVNVRELGVDLLSASGHKFNGPRGIGFLFIRKGLRLSPYMDGGGQEKGMRAGTTNTAAIVGMAAALRKNVDLLTSSLRNKREAEEIFLKTLSEYGAAFRLNGGTNRVPGFLSLAFPGFDGEAILHRMDLAGICVSTGAACSGDKTEISHVLRAIRLVETAARGTVRITFGRENTPEEAKLAAQTLARITSFKAERNDGRKENGT